MREIVIVLTAAVLAAIAMAMDNAYILYSSLFLVMISIVLLSHRFYHLHHFIQEWRQSEKIRYDNLKHDHDGQLRSLDLNVSRQQEKVGDISSRVHFLETAQKNMGKQQFRDATTLNALLEYLNLRFVPAGDQPQPKDRIELAIQDDGPNTKKDDNSD